MLETRREKIVILGGAPVILILFYMLAGGTDAEEEVAAPVRTPAPAMAARPAPPGRAPVAAPVTVPVHVEAQRAPADAPPLGGISLTGVLGAGRDGSAVVSYPGGTQRLVAVGRDVLPGLTLREVRRDRILLEGPAGPVALSFGGAVQAAAASAGSSQAAAERYVRAMEPQRTGGRVVGYRLRSAGDIPLLARAGLQAGDVLLSVNGNAIDGQERLTGIPAEIAGAATVDVEFQRGGTKMRTRIPAR